jgi:uncharacterized OB-fold protein
MRMLPELTPENSAFWTGGKDGQLLITCCDDCGRAIHPPQAICPFCRSMSVTPQPAVGTGRIYARTINRQQWSADLRVPYMLALIELDGLNGVRLTARVESGTLDAVSIGDRVSVDFEEDRDIWVPFFRIIRGIANNSDH